LLCSRAVGSGVDEANVQRLRARLSVRKKLIQGIATGDEESSKYEAARKRATRLSADLDGVRGDAFHPDRFPAVATTSTPTDTSSVGSRKIDLDDLTSPRESGGSLYLSATPPSSLDSPTPLFKAASFHRQSMTDELKSSQALLHKYERAQGGSPVTPRWQAAR
jgi:hypothetical protein